ncbi:MAG TPA: hypothetical protein VK191_05080 [Symbiobacteriaceae bacterium]|nr:hypothetical protein [Symbiobacteriaceae bacterium]
MEQLFPFNTEEPDSVLMSDLPVELVETFPVDAMAARWPWKTDFLRLFSKYWSARRMRAWPRALRSLHEARCYAIAGEQWDLESWINDLIVEAVAKREARRR